MTKRNQPKEIYTFTRLLELTQNLKVSDPGECRNRLFGWFGSDKLIDGLNVMVRKDSKNSIVCFHLRSPGQTDDYCHVYGNVIDGKAYTQFVGKFSTSYYRKKLHKFLPWDLPDGCRTENSVRLVINNADGSIARDQRDGWFSGYRGDCGRARNLGSISLRDSDGQFVSGDMPGLSKLAAVLNVPVAESLGIAPDSVGPREWFDSMVGPHWNSNKVRLLAIKAYKEAVRMVEANPHMKIALYPMKVSEIGDLYIPSRIGKGTANAHVLERDSDMEPIMYRLPELCLYWVQPHAKYPDHNPTELHHIYVTVPPHGCRLLEMDCESIPASTYRHGKRTAPDTYQSAVNKGWALERVAYTFGPKTKGPEGSVKWGSNPELVKVKVMGEGSKALKPEDAFNSLEEAALMGSLPLC